MPQTLPIDELRPALEQALPEHRRILISAPTGSGKSTRIPQILLDSGYFPAGQIVVLQPRRMAARMLAARVAWERGDFIGNEVGYQVRMQKRWGPATRIRYVTEGILLRELLRDATCRDVAAIVLDEFHERHLYGDVLLAHSLGLQQTSRPDLLIVIMSATMDDNSLRHLLNPCRLLFSEGRTHSVHVRYLSKPLTKKTQVWDAAGQTVADAMAEGLEGDILVFMPGAFEIRKTIEAIRRIRNTPDYCVMPLHGELPAHDQDAAMAPNKKRKIIVSTNVAETSLTIEGIRIIVDGGLARHPAFDPHRGINTLYIRKISQASADQRAGRAGRTAPGVCLRLWTEKEHDNRHLHDTPEIMRLELAEIFLLLKACHLDSTSLPWLDSPPSHTHDQAITLLRNLGAVTGEQDIISPLGHQMAAFPMHPRYARLLLAADQFNCVREIALIAALAQGRSILITNPGKPALDRRASITRDSADSDFFTLMDAYAFAKNNQFRTTPCRDTGIHAQAANQAGSLMSSILAIAEEQGLRINREPASEETIGRCLTLAFIDQLAHRRDGGTLRCQVIHSRRGELAKNSAVRNTKLLVAAEIHEVQASRGDVTVRLQQATAVEESWLRESFPEDFREERVTDFDASGKRLVSIHQVRFRDLVLRRKPVGNPDAESAATLLAEAVYAGRFAIKAWDYRVEQWISRINSLSLWCPELKIPPVSDEVRRTLLQRICSGAFSAREVRDRPVWPVLRQWLDPAQQVDLDTYVPEKFSLPSGRNVKITYDECSPPKIAARIQDLYGVKDVLTIAKNRIRLCIHVLTPNQREVQVTDSLRGFWENTYPGVKKELQRRYPKHEWR